MTELVIWGAGTVAAAAVILGAAAMYGWYAYLAGRLPLAVHSTRLESELAELAGRRKVLEGEVEGLRQQKADLDAEAKEARSWLEQNRERIASIPIMEKQILEVEATLREKREGLEQLENEILRAKGQRLQEQERLAELLANIEKARRELTDVQTQKNHLEAELESLGKHYRQLCEKRLEAERACHQKEEQLRGLESRAAQAEARLEEATAQRQSAEKACRQAELRRDAALQQRDSLVQEVAAKQSLLGSLQRTLEGLTQRVDMFRQTMEPPPVARRLADFCRPVLAGQKKGPPVAAKEAEEQRRLEACEAHLQKNGYRFPRRTLYAFHTSLKTADICPLVILAGISGTGKSQLPRLYAEAIGMYFLNVAVQPRWDAPQDLFGFYNYMEHSYKATELARALREMDRRNWPAKSKSEQRVQQGMLLVLLDEMNLARVEYYFSELLSKLEMRNAVGIDGSDSLGLADIEIEVGPLESGESARRLFVGPNVLFVGTMNEDETTQALSDKVLDRSNVLRFGKPGELKFEKPPRHEPPDAYLPYSVWRGWVRSDLPDEQRETFDRDFRALNAALAKIHRPYGHRVYQAMYRYVANYPRWDESWFHQAVADQLEQKIIPRLRGLSRDTDENADEVLREMQQVIAKLDDKPLEEAFKQACERSVFQWVGVQRGQSEE